MYIQQYINLYTFFKIIFEKREIRDFENLI